MSIDKIIDNLLDDTSKANAEDIKNYQEEINQHFAELLDEELSLTGQES